MAHLVRNASFSEDYKNFMLMISPGTAPSTLTLIGIYGCGDPIAVQTPGTLCHRLVIISGPSEWFLALMWMCFLLTICFDLYHIKEVREVFILYQNRPTPGALGSDHRALLQSYISSEFDTSHLSLGTTVSMGDALYDPYMTERP